MFFVILFIIAALLVAADQLIKLWAVDKLMPVGSMDFIKIGDFKILDLTYLENDGAIFGTMSGQQWFLIGFTMIIIIAGIVAIVWFAKSSRFMSVCTMLFVAGGIGNLIDRIRYSYVVDMFEIKLFRFAIFNFADICVTVAFVLIFVYMVFFDRQKPEKKAEKNE